MRRNLTQSSVGCFWSQYDKVPDQGPTSLSQRRATTSKAFSKCGTDGRTDFGTEFYFEGFAGKMQK
jgi:hypothetical protein